MASSKEKKKDVWEKLKKDYPNNYMKVYEVKDRIDAYVDETYRCWIDQEASMKKNGLRSMFEQILEDGKQLATMEGNNESK